MLFTNEIAKTSPMIPIREIVQKLGIDDKYADPYGRYKAKITYDFYNDHSTDDPGKLIVIGSLDPAFECTDAQNCAIGIADAMTWDVNKKCSVVFSQPVSGPLFDDDPQMIGEGFCQLVPDDEITTHFTGDLYAFLAAVKLMFLIPEKHVLNGNMLKLDFERMMYRDLSLFETRKDTEWAGIAKERSKWLHDLFRIPAVIDLQCAFNLAEDLNELRSMIAKIRIAFNEAGDPVTIGELKGEEQVCALLAEAFRPNLVQTIEGYPAFVHGISLQGTGLYGGSLHTLKAALALDDIVITSGGSLSDGSLQRNLDIRFRAEDNIRPARIAIAFSVNALKQYGGIDTAHLLKAGQLQEACRKLIAEIAKYKSMYGQKPLLFISRRADDDPGELDEITETLRESLTDYCFVDTVTLGSQGGRDAAHLLYDLLMKHTAFYKNHRLTDNIKDDILSMICDETGIENAQFAEGMDERIELFRGTIAEKDVVLSIVPLYAGGTRPEGIITGIALLSSDIMLIYLK